MDKPNLDKPMTVSEFLRQNAEFRRQSSKALHDRASMLEGARAEGKLEIAQKMLNRGMSKAEILDLTGLSEKDLAHLNTHANKAE
ncbi:hypothetical protein ACFFSY_00445 [Paenibacillus aurantiacus]|uniref:Transposase/invertase (TIGR01784 family) n=1 Tax=Paenibacillus aurantiacus TaxID=1936118 RepID=A0ABV5KGX0_9BACL